VPAYSHFDYYLRTVTTAVLAIAILGVAGWQVLSGGDVTGPFKDWAGIIIGVYFGQHVSLNGSGSRRRVAESQGETPPQVPVVPIAIVTPPPNGGPTP